MFVINSSFLAQRAKPVIIYFHISDTISAWNVLPCHVVVLDSSIKVVKQDDLVVSGYLGYF